MIFGAIGLKKGIKSMSKIKPKTKALDAMKTLNPARAKPMASMKTYGAGGGFSSLPNMSA